MSVIRLTRRQMLVGAGGFTLGLPFMHSLLPKGVKAASNPTERRFVAFCSNHGGIDELAMFPGETYDQTESVLAGHDVSSGPLVLNVDGERAGVSEILTAGADRFTESLLAKMNVIRGLDVPWYIAHHTGGHLGNYARNDGNGADGQAAQANSMPTIDQLMAWSNSFYDNLAGVTERALIFGSERLSYNWTNPSERTGGIQEVTGDQEPLAMFNRVFVPEEDPNEPAPRPPIVDRVFESYQSLRQSDRRLSTEDKQRLDDHMDRLSELQRKLNNDAGRRASCGDAPTPSGNPDVALEYYQMVNDVIATAFLCGTSRIAVVKVRESWFSDFAGDWHQDVAHQYGLDGPQGMLRDVNQQLFEHVMLDLAWKLDVEEAPDCNVLDSSLIQWTQESGERTHDSRSVPLITFGGAGGNLPTGRVCDYRKMTEDGIVSAWGTPLGNSGLLYTQWLSQAMQMMGMDISEFQDIAYNGATGYGLDYRDDNYAATHSDGILEMGNERLPFLSV